MCNHVARSMHVSYTTQPGLVWISSPMYTVKEACSSCAGSHCTRCTWDCINGVGVAVRLTPDPPAVSFGVPHVGSHDSRYAGAESHAFAFGSTVRISSQSQHALSGPEFVCSRPISAVARPQGYTRSLSHLAHIFDLNDIPPTFATPTQIT